MSAPDPERAPSSLHPPGAAAVPLFIASVVLLPLATFAPFLASGRPAPLLLSMASPVAAALSGISAARSRRPFLAVLAALVLLLWVAQVALAPQIQTALGASPNGP